MDATRPMAFRAIALATLLSLSACSEDRPTPLSNVDAIVIDIADVETVTNINISNPTLETPETFEVSPGDALTLVWSDEFDGVNLDPETWFFATGDGSEKDLPRGWGNNELQYYLPDNAMLVNGVLEITARREQVEDFNYTSARINTEDRFAFKYGRIEASIKLPPGQGIWPAFWMLSQDSEYVCNGRPCNWAATGEIDIMEAVNLDGTGGNDIYGTLHYGGEFPANTETGERYTPSVDVTEGFHTYALEWDEFEIRWYFDGELYAMQNSWFSTAAPYPAPFNQSFHILLNVAVGGNFPGSPNASTVFPATMEVDWVRVYSGEEASGPVADRGISPDVVILSSDPNATPDLVFGEDYDSFEAFGSGSTFADRTDRDFAYSLAITTGNGYGAEIGQLGIAGFDAGFASSYSTLNFKAKGLNNDLIRVKFLDDGEYVNVALTTSIYSTALGNGWYQVSLPLSIMSGVATGTTLLFETDNSAPGPFTFLITDLGFSGTAGSGGGSGGEGTELIVNGDFEGGTLGGWLLFQNFGVIDVSSPGASGNFAINIDASGGTKNPTIKQSNLGAGQLQGGQQVMVSFDWKGSAAVGGVVDIVLFTESSTAGITRTDVILSGGAVPADWTSVGPIPINIGADATGGVTLQITAVCGGDTTCVSDLFLDNISITAVGVTAGGGGTGGGTGGGGTGGGGSVGTAEGDIAVNGGFETGDLSGWELFPNGGIQAVTTANPSSGSFSANLTVPVRQSGDPAVDNLIKNANLEAGNLTSNGPITVSFDMRGSLSGAGGVVFAELFSELSGGGTSKAEILSGGPLSPTSDWTTYSYTTTLGDDVNGGVTLQLKTSCGPVVGCGVDAFFDNVVITIP